MKNPVWEATRRVSAPVIAEAGAQVRAPVRVSSRAEAERKARAEARRRNENAVTARLTVAGDPRYIAGTIWEIAGLGVFDGRYFILSARHVVTNEKYTTEIEARKILVEY